MTYTGNMVEMQRRFFTVSIHVDGALVAERTVSAYTEDMAVIHMVLPEILARLGLAEMPLALMEGESNEQKTLGDGEQLPNVQNHHPN